MADNTEGLTDAEIIEIDFSKANKSKPFVPKIVK
jgi:hypothetical protein